MIDTTKLVEIAVRGLVALIVGIICAFVGYLLGKKQSDDNWKCELAQREKERNEQNRPKTKLVNWNIK